jgi:hypothetical protein
MKIASAKIGVVWFSLAEKALLSFARTLCCLK